MLLSDVCGGRRRPNSEQRGGPGRVRRGAAILAAAHNLSIIPIRVTATAEAMPIERVQSFFENGDGGLGSLALPAPGPKAETVQGPPPG